MRFLTFRSAAGAGLGVRRADGDICGLAPSDRGFPGRLETLLAGGEPMLRAAFERLSEAPRLDPAALELLPPILTPEKIVCIGLNYADHTKESGFEQPDYPTVFSRYRSSLVGHGSPIVVPRVSRELDYEGELVAVIGRRGRNIDRKSALEHIAGYSIFNDATLRDYQFKTTQWTMGKNFDSTGAFGPELVTADELPPGCAGLRLQTRLNGELVQDASIDDLIFDIATLVHLLSEVMTLEPGDLIVSGTPSGAGFARKPPLWLQAGDACSVAIEEIGELENPIAEEREP